MKNVNSKFLTNLVDTNECGSFVKLWTANYKGHKYCYRPFDELYFDKWVLKNMWKLTEEEFSKQYLKPIFMVDKYKGTLSEYAENTFDLSFICDRDKKIKYLKRAKELVLDLHNKYKYIHGDLSGANFIVDDIEDELYLCDFDTAIKIGKEPIDYNWFSDNLFRYFNYYKFDKKIDIYKFNLMTIALILNKYEYEVFELIEQNQLGEFQGDKDIKKLTKELLLLDTKKPYSGEFIIDYIDDCKYRI